MSAAIPNDSGAIVTTRVLAVAREAVFAACRDPRRLAQWWGPQGFTNEFEICEFQPGGAWRFTMRAPDGAAYAMDHRFLEIMPSERIVVRHLQPGHDFTLTITLAAQGERTAITWHMRFDDPAEADRVRAFVVPANEQNLDRLAAHLAATV